MQIWSFLDACRRTRTRRLPAPTTLALLLHCNCISPSKRACVRLRFSSSSSQLLVKPSKAKQSIHRPVECSRAVPDDQRCRCKRACAFPFNVRPCDAWCQCLCAVSASAVASTCPAKPQIPGLRAKQFKLSFSSTTVSVACIAKKLKPFPGWNTAPSLTWLLLLLLDVAGLFSLTSSWLSCACCMPLYAGIIFIVIHRLIVANNMLLRNEELPKLELFFDDVPDYANVKKYPRGMLLDQMFSSVPTDWCAVRVREVPIATVTIHIRFP